MGRPYAWRAGNYQHEPLSIYAEHPWNRAIARIWHHYDARHGPFARPFTTSWIFTEWLEAYVMAPLFSGHLCRYLKRHGLIQKSLRPQMAYRDLSGKRHFRPSLLLWSWTDRAAVYRMSNAARRVELMRQHHGVFGDDDYNLALLTPLVEKADHYRTRLEEQERLLQLAESYGVSPESLGYRIGTHKQLRRYANAAELALRQVTLSPEDAKPRTGYIGFDNQGKIKRKANHQDHQDQPDPPDWF